MTLDSELFNNPKFCPFVVEMYHGAPINCCPLTLAKNSEYFKCLIGREEGTSFRKEDVFEDEYEPVFKFLKYIHLGGDLVSMHIRDYLTMFIFADRLQFKQSYLKFIAGKIVKMEFNQSNFKELLEFYELFGKKQFFFQNKFFEKLVSVFEQDVDIDELVKDYYVEDFKNILCMVQRVMKDKTKKSDVCPRIDCPRQFNSSKHPKTNRNGVILDINSGLNFHEYNK